MEDKSKKKLYPKEWILLEEPVEDIHSLIYYSKALISSGDSMAREASVLGIPGIYIGQRIMSVNSVLQDLSELHIVKIDRFDSEFKNIIKNATYERQKIIREMLDEEFISVNKFIKKIVKIIVK